MNPYSIPPLIVAFSFLLLGYFCYRKVSTLNYAKIFTLLCLATFCWQFTWALLFSTKDIAIANVLIKIGYAVIIFIPVFYYHFVLAFLNIRENIFLDYVFLRFSYLAAFIFEISLFFTDLFIFGSYKYIWGYYPKANYVLHLPFLIMLILQGCRAIYLLFIYSHRNETTGNYKKQIRLMFYSFLIYFFAATDFLCNYGYEFYPLGFIYILIASSIITYTISKHQFMDIRVIIKRTVVYSILSFILTAIVLSSIVLGEMVFREIIGYHTIWTTVIAVFIISASFQPLRDKIQCVVDKVFFKAKYDYQKTLKNLSQSSTTIKGIDELFKNIVKDLKNTLKVKKISLYLIKDESFIFKYGPYDD